MGDWNLDALLLLRTHLAWAGLLLFIGLEALLPFSKPKQVRWRHYLVNVALAGANLALLRLVWGGLLLGAAFYASQRQIGLFYVLGLGEPWRIVLTFLFFDALSYTMHVLYHYLPALWRLHQVHHSDRDYDVTTASRFHFGEILFSTMVQTLFAVGLGASPLGLVLFQALFLFQAQFQHANLHLPERLDWWVRWLIVTPNMHRVHHSVVRAETNSNFSTFFSLWDRLGGTFRWGPPQESIRIGLLAYPRSDQVGLTQILLMPFRPIPPDEEPAA
jgi:sterol desaturase/sphingolipid hydroxylase (fatty acid hydroxylase superfamily)